MSEQIKGEAKVAQDNLPGVKNISSTTNTDPIIITTSAAHSITEGELFTTFDAADPALANGTTFIAGTVTTTTITVLEWPTGATVAGTLVGGAVGNVQSLGFGPSYPIPSDTTDDMDAASVGVPFEAGADRIAWLMWFVQFFQTFKPYGRLRFADPGFIDALDDAAMTVTGGLWSLVSATWTWGSDTIVKLLGEKVLWRPRVTLADVNQTVNVSQGDRFFLANVPGAPRVITLGNTGALDGQTMTFIVAAPVGSVAALYTWQTTTPTVVATYDCSPTDTPNPFCIVEFERVAGVWRLGMNNGQFPDSMGVPVGVIPGVGA